jgi:hypothetical protein
MHESPIIEFSMLTCRIGAMTFAHSFYNMDNVLHIYDSEYVYNVETNVALDSSDLQVDAIWINQWNKRNKKIIRDYSRWFS